MSYLWGLRSRGLETRAIELKILASDCEDNFKDYICLMIYYTLVRIFHMFICNNESSIYYILKILFEYTY